jgi:hypothetical protein
VSQKTKGLIVKYQSFVIPNLNPVFRTLWWVKIKLPLLNILSKVGSHRGVGAAVGDKRNSYLHLSEMFIVIQYFLHSVHLTFFSCSVPIKTLCKD